jgi:hypothetical protein
MVVSQAVGVEAACCDRETDALQRASGGAGLRVGGRKGAAD